MRKNFLVGQSNEILIDEISIDLHNSYEYVGLFFRGNDRSLQLLFRPAPKFGKHNESIVIYFREIDYFEISSDFGTRIIRGLDEIGYKNPNDYDDSWLLEEEQSTPDDHLFLRMDGAEYLRIHCGHVFVVQEESLVLGLDWSEMQLSIRENIRFNLLIDHLTDYNKGNIPLSSIVGEVVLYIDALERITKEQRTALLREWRALEWAFATAQGHKVTQDSNESSEIIDRAIKNLFQLFTERYRRD